MREKRELSQQVKALLLGGMCAAAYLAVYVAKNALSAATPKITLSNAFSIEQIGSLSSAYFIAYAVGQLINGAIGDRIKSKYMISFGLALASVGFWVLPLFAGRTVPATVFYSASGFFMAMIYGPMTKVVAENVDPRYAPRCSIGYTLASYLGSPVAGLLASALGWKPVFCVSGSILVIFGIICFAVFTAFERKGLVRYGQYERKDTRPAGGIRVLLKRKILKFALISMLTGIVRTTVVFWLPTYLTEHLNYTPEQAGVLFSVITLAIASSAFVALITYERLGRNMEKTALLSFGCSAACFLALSFVRNPAANLVLIGFAILFNNCAATVLWSCYCPSLYDTGMVSGATGFLDCCSYLAAAVASTIFANAVGLIGWSGLILVWFVLMACGVLTALPWGNIYQHERE